MLTISNLRNIINKNSKHQNTHFVAKALHLKMCSSRKYPYPPHGRSMEIPRGWRVSKAQVWGLTGISRGVEVFKPITFHGRGMDVFWNNTILFILFDCHTALLLLGLRISLCIKTILPCKQSSLSVLKN